MDVPYTRRKLLVTHFYNAMNIFQTIYVKFSIKNIHKFIWIPIIQFTIACIFSHGFLGGGGLEQVLISFVISTISYRLSGCSPTEEFKIFTIYSHIGLFRVYMFTMMLNSFMREYFIIKFISLKNQCLKLVFDTLQNTRNIL